MKYALFLGCTIPGRARNYELSARKVAGKLGVELVDLEQFVCCGFPIRNSDQAASKTMAAYNLCLARDQGLDICTLCSSCATGLSEVERELSAISQETSELAERLKRAGLRYTTGVRVRHLARILYEEVRPEKIRKNIRRDLSALKIAVHYGCHYLKPSEIHEHFDDAESPISIEKLVEMTGAAVVNYPGQNRCCGGPILPVDEKLALSVAKDKLDGIRDAGADALCVVCPFCAVMYDGNQRIIESAFDMTYELPVLYLTQILGLAMGYDKKSLGLNLNVVKTAELLKRYFE